MLTIIVNIVIFKIKQKANNKHGTQTTRADVTTAIKALSKAFRNMQKVIPPTISLKKHLYFK